MAGTEILQAPFSDAPGVPIGHGREHARVLHVVPSLYGGGMERMLLRLIERSARQAEGDRHAVSVRHGVCVLQQGDDRWIRLCRSLGPTWVAGLQGGLFAGGCLAWRRLRAIIRDFMPHVVHARSTAIWFDATLATRGLRDVRLVLGFHGQTEAGPPSRKRRWLNRWSASRADAVCSVSRQAAQMMHEQWRVDDARLHVMPNGVDTARFRPLQDPQQRSRLRRSIGLEDSHHVVLCVANLVPVKAIDVLLQSWRQVGMADRDARLMIAGDGPLRVELHELARRLRCASNVRFLGAREDVADLLRTADLFVLPSRYEGCSNGVLEAMATGVPIIASDVGGLPELIEPHRSGWLVPPGRPDRLSATLLAALLDASARRRVGELARETAVARFDLDLCVARHHALYRTLSRPQARAERIMGGVTCAG